MSAGNPAGSLKIPFTKAHGAQNDFLLTWDQAVSAAGRQPIARAICHRHTGAGADGWLLVAPPVDAAANEALVKLLAQHLDCPRNRVELVRGHTSRHKTIKLYGLAPEDVVKKLGHA